MQFIYRKCCTRATGKVQNIVMHMVAIEDWKKMLQHETQLYTEMIWATICWKCEKQKKTNTDKKMTAIYTSMESVNMHNIYQCILRKCDFPKTRLTCVMCIVI